MGPLLLAIIAPAISGLLTLTLRPGADSRPARTFLALLGPAVTLLALGKHLYDHGVQSLAIAWPWMPSLQLDLALHADPLGLFFALLVSGIGFLIVLYARAYFGRDDASLYRFYPSLLLFMTAMLGVALADDFLLLLLFWELTSISSFLLIGWERDDPAAVKKAMQAFIVTGAGGLSLMGGLILLGVHTGVWSFSELLAIRDTLTAGPVLATALVLIFGGAAAKSAQWPLHFWLPGAMAAPTPVSAYLHSATMVKAGIYLMGRLWPVFATLPAMTLWPMLLVPIGGVTMLYGAMVALRKDDLKQIFAYTTVSQLGLLMTMYGLAAYPYHGQPNLLFDVTQILNHALYKAPLFILAGAIGHVASRNLSELRGFFHRGRSQAVMTLTLLLAAYAMAAGPFTLSFSAKELFFYQIVHAIETTGSPLFWILAMAAVLTGLCNVTIFLRLATTLLRRPATQATAGHHDDDTHDHHYAPHETGPWPAFLWIPGLLIVAWQYILGIVPFAHDKLIGPLDPSMGHYAFHTLLGQTLPLTWDAHLGWPLAMSVIAASLGVALAITPWMRSVWQDPHDRLYPAFYTLTTQGGGSAFRTLQNGHLTTYLALTFLALACVVGWTLHRTQGVLCWPESLVIEPVGELLPGYLLTALVCTTAVGLAILQQRVTRVLTLGACGFCVAGVYYFYQAPDLALTQIAIEIVSLILFLLVLSLLPAEPTPSAGAPRRRRHSFRRLVVAAMVGGVMFWLTLTSAVGDRPASPHHSSDGAPIAHLGHYFLRNSLHGLDTMAIPADQLGQAGVIDRGPGHASSHTPDTPHTPDAPDDMTPLATLHKGGGGRNVVNVILVDFRGFDTMGEITVLGLAALGVWALLAHRRQEDDDDDVAAVTDVAPSQEVSR